MGGIGRLILMFSLSRVTQVPIPGDPRPLNDFDTRYARHRAAHTHVYLKSRNPGPYTG